MTGSSSLIKRPIYLFLLGCIRGMLVADLIIGMPSLILPMSVALERARRMLITSNNISISFGVGFILIEVLWSFALGYTS